MSDEDPAGASVPDERAATVRATYGWSATSPTAALVETVAAATGHEPTRLDPLLDSLDPDAVDTLIRGRRPRRLPGTYGSRFDTAATT